jgi:hypothetical protein
MRKRSSWLVGIVVGATVGGLPAAVPAQEPAWPAPPHRVLIVGTFHFRDAGLDNFRPTEEIDIRSPTRQREVADLVDRLAAFAPTRVAVEVMPSHQAWLDSLYAEYLNDRHPLGPNEVFQVGFRLARRLGHPRVYAVDAERRFYDPWVDPDAYAVEQGQTSRLDPDLDSLYQRSHRYEDQLKMRQTLREYLLHLNQPKRLLRSHGQYLIGNFEVGTNDEYPGVDSKTAWYNRNLRIFANLLRLIESPHERVLLLIGAGHVPILRHAAEASPQFELVELADVLGGARSP